MQVDTVPGIWLDIGLKGPGCWEGLGYLTGDCFPCRYRFASRAVPAAEDEVLIYDDLVGVESRKQV